MVHGEDEREDFQCYKSIPTCNLFHHGLNWVHRWRRRRSWTWHSPEVEISIRSIGMASAIETSSSLRFSTPIVLIGLVRVLESTKLIVNDAGKVRAGGMDDDDDDDARHAVVDLKEMVKLNVGDRIGRPMD